MFSPLRFCFAVLVPVHVQKREDLCKIDCEGARACRSGVWKKGGLLGNSWPTQLSLESVRNDGALVT